MSDDSIKQFFYTILQLPQTSGHTTTTKSMTSLLRGQGYQTGHKVVGNQPIN